MVWRSPGQTSNLDWRRWRGAPGQANAPGRYPNWLSSLAVPGRLGSCRGRRTLAKGLLTLAPFHHPPAVFVDFGAAATTGSLAFRGTVQLEGGQPRGRRGVTSGGKRSSRCNKPVRSLGPAPSNGSFAQVKQFMLGHLGFGNPEPVSLRVFVKMMLRQLEHLTCRLRRCDGRLTLEKPRLDGCCHRRCDPRPPSWFSGPPTAHKISHEREELQPESSSLGRVDLRSTKPWARLLGSGLFAKTSNGQSPDRGTCEARSGIQ